MKITKIKLKMGRIYDFEGWEINHVLCSKKHKVTVVMTNEKKKPKKEKDVV